MQNLAVVLRQAVKFVLVGGLNTLIDLGILYLLMKITGIEKGLGWSIFKGVSFTAAVINSYILNKFWTFKATGSFGKFFIISLIGFAINVGVASLVVNVIGNPFVYSGISDKLWAIAGSIIATFCTMAWNFIGYKFIVFKR